MVIGKWWTVQHCFHWWAVLFVVWNFQEQLTCCYIPWNTKMQTRWRNCWENTSLNNTSIVTAPNGNLPTMSIKQVSYWYSADYCTQIRNQPIKSTFYCPDIQRYQVADLIWHDIYVAHSTEFENSKYLIVTFLVWLFRGIPASLIVAMCILAWILMTPSKSPDK